MYRQKKHNSKTILRALALLTLIAFVCTDTLFSLSSSLAETPSSTFQGGQNTRDLSASAQDWKTLVPPELGKIDEVYFPTTDRGPQTIDKKEKAVNHGLRTVVYIQDAHDSMEAQENIAKIIDHLVANEGVRTVFEEGYEGPVPTDDYFGFIKDPETKRKVSYFLMDRLRIRAAEYAHINRHSRLDHSPNSDQLKRNGNGGNPDYHQGKVNKNQDRPQTPDPSQGNVSSHGPSTMDHGPDWQLIGADSLALHKENIDEYRLSSEKKRSIEKDLKKLEKELQALVLKRFSKELCQWLKLKEQFDTKKLDLFTYLGRTMSLFQGSTAGVKYRGSEDTHRVFSGATETAAIPLLRFLMEAAKSNDPVVIEKAKKIDAREVYEELGKIEDEIKKAYLKDATDQELFHDYKIIRLLKRLNDLEMTQEEYEVVKAGLASFCTRSFGQFIHQNIPKPLVLSKQWEKNIQDAVHFYEIAAERDGAVSAALDKYFLVGRNAQLAMQAPRSEKVETPHSKLIGIEPAILVYGGFHKENIKRILEAKGISYVVVSPRITQPSPRHEAYYKKLMSGELHAFEIPLSLRTATATLSAFETHFGRIEIRRVTEVLKRNRNADVLLLDRYFDSPKAKQPLAPGLKASSTSRKERPVRSALALGERKDSRVGPFEGHGRSESRDFGLNAIRDHVTERFGTPVRLSDEMVRAYFGEKVLTDSQREGRTFFIRTLDQNQDLHFLAEWKTELAADEEWLKAREAKGALREDIIQRFPYFGVIQELSLGVLSKVGDEERLEGFIGFEGIMEGFDAQKAKHTFHIAVPQMEVRYKNVGRSGQIKEVADLLTDELILMASNPALRVTGGIYFNAQTPGSQEFAKRRHFESGESSKKSFPQSKISEEAYRIKMKRLEGNLRFKARVRVQEIKKLLTGVANLEDRLDTHHYNAKWHREGSEGKGGKAAARLWNHLQNIIDALQRILLRMELTEKRFMKLFDLVTRQLVFREEEMEAAVLAHDLGKKETAKDKGEGNWSFHGHPEAGYELLHGKGVQYKGKDLSPTVLLTVKYHDAHWQIDYTQPNAFEEKMREMRRDFEGSAVEFLAAVEFMIAFSVGDVLGALWEGDRPGDLDTVQTFYEKFNHWRFFEIARIFRSLGDQEAVVNISEGGRITLPKIFGFEKGDSVFCLLVPGDGSEFLVFSFADFMSWMHDYFESGKGASREWWRNYMGLYGSSETVDNQGRISLKDFAFAGVKLTARPIKVRRVRSENPKPVGVAVKPVKEETPAAPALLPAEKSKSRTPPKGLNVYELFDWYFDHAAGEVREEKAAAAAKNKTRIAESRSEMRSFNAGLREKIFYALASMNFLITAVAGFSQDVVHLTIQSGAAPDQITLRTQAPPNFHSSMIYKSSDPSTFTPVVEMPLTNGQSSLTLATSGNPSAHDFFRGQANKAMLFQNPLLNNAALLRLNEDTFQGLDRSWSNGLPLNQTPVLGSGFLKISDAGFGISEQMILAMNHAAHPVPDPNNSSRYISDPLNVQQRLLTLTGVLLTQTARHGLTWNGTNWGILPEVLLPSGSEFTTELKTIPGTTQRGIAFSAFDAGILAERAIILRDAMKQGLIRGLNNSQLGANLDQLLANMNFRIFVDGNGRFHQRVWISESGQLVYDNYYVDNKHTEAKMFLPLIYYGMFGDPKQALSLWNAMTFNYQPLRAGNKMAWTGIGDAGATAYPEFYFAQFYDPQVAPHSWKTSMTNYMRGGSYIGGQLGYRVFVSAPGMSTNATYTQFGFKNFGVAVPAGSAMALSGGEASAFSGLTNFISMAQATGGYVPGFGFYDAHNPVTGVDFNSVRIFSNGALLAEYLNYPILRYLVAQLPSNSYVTNVLSSMDAGYPAPAEVAISLDMAAAFISHGVLGTGSETLSSSRVWTVNYTNTLSGVWGKFNNFTVPTNAVMGIYLGPQASVQQLKIELKFNGATRWTDYTPSNLKPYQLLDIPVSFSGPVNEVTLTVNSGPGSGTFKVTSLFFYVPSRSEARTEGVKASEVRRNIKDVLRILKTCSPLEREVKRNLLAKISFVDAVGDAKRILWDLKAKRESLESSLQYLLTLTMPPQQAHPGKAGKAVADFKGWITFYQAMRDPKKMEMLLRSDRKSMDELEKSLALLYIESAIAKTKIWPHERPITRGLIDAVQAGLKRESPHLEQPPVTDELVKAVQDVLEPLRAAFDREYPQLVSLMESIARANKVRSALIDFGTNATDSGPGQLSADAGPARSETRSAGALKSGLKIPAHLISERTSEGVDSERRIWGNILFEEDREIAVAIAFDRHGKPAIFERPDQPGRIIRIERKVSGSEFPKFLGERKALPRLQKEPAVADVPRLVGVGSLPSGEGIWLEEEGLAGAVPFILNPDRARSLVPPKRIDGMAHYLEGKPSLVLGALIRAGEILGRVHARGIVHNDFKPSNIFIGPSGRLMLGDFELASEEGSEMPSGTLEFMAPEMVKTFCSDVYSFLLTVVYLYEKLAALPGNESYRPELMKMKRRYINAAFKRFEVTSSPYENATAEIVKRERYITRAEAGYYEEHLSTAQLLDKMEKLYRQLKRLGSFEEREPGERPELTEVLKWLQEDQKAFREASGVRALAVAKTKDLATAPDEARQPRSSNFARSEARIFKDLENDPSTIMLVEREFGISGEDALTRFFKRGDGALFRAVVLQLMEEFGIDPENEASVNKVLNVARIITRKGAGEWQRCRKVLDFFKQNIGFDLKKLSAGRQRRVLTAVYGLGLRGVGFSRFQNILGLVEKELGIKIRDIKGSEKQRVVTAAFYLSRAKEDPSRGFKSGEAYLQDFFGLLHERFGIAREDLAALDLKIRIRLLTGAYSVAGAKAAGFKTFTGTLDVIRIIFGIEPASLRGSPADQIRLITAAYEVSRRKAAGLKAFADTLSRINTLFDIRPEAMLTLDFEDKMSLISAAYSVSLSGEEGVQAFRGTLTGMEEFFSLTPEVMRGLELSDKISLITAASQVGRNGQQGMNAFRGTIDRIGKRFDISAHSMPKLKEKLRLIRVAYAVSLNRAEGLAAFDKVLDFIGQYFDLQTVRIKRLSPEEKVLMLSAASRICFNLAEGQRSFEAALKQMASFFDMTPGIMRELEGSQKVRLITAASIISTTLEEGRTGFRDTLAHTASYWGLDAQAVKRLEISSKVDFIAALYGVPKTGKPGFDLYVKILEYIDIFFKLQPEVRKQLTPERMIRITTAACHVAAEGPSGFKAFRTMLRWIRAVLKMTPDEISKLSADEQIKLMTAAYQIAGNHGNNLEIFHKLLRELAGSFGLEFSTLPERSQKTGLLTALYPAVTNGEEGLRIFLAVRDQLRAHFGIDADAAQRMQFDDKILLITAEASVSAGGKNDLQSFVQTLEMFESAGYPLKDLSLNDKLKTIHFTYRAPSYMRRLRLPEAVHTIFDEMLRSRPAGDQKTAAAAGRFYHGVTAANVRQKALQKTPELPGDIQRSEVRGGLSSPRFELPVSEAGSDLLIPVGRGSAVRSAPVFDTPARMHGRTGNASEGVFLLKQPVVFSIAAKDLAELPNWQELLASASFNPRKLFIAVSGTGSTRSEARIAELAHFVTVLRDEQLSNLPKTAPVFHFGNMADNANVIRARMSEKFGRPIKALLGIARGSFLLPALLLDEQVSAEALLRRGGFLFDDGHFTGRFLEVLFQSFEIISAAA